MRRVVSLATTAMLLLSWTLWVGTDRFPQVPLLPWLPESTPALAWAVYIALVAAVLMTGLASRWRLWFGFAGAMIVALIGQDQHRFQPWIYQFVMTVVFFAALPRKEGLELARWWFIALYVHSGLSKLDISFCDELGSVFLRVALTPLGIDPALWPTRWRFAAVLVMPIGELAVAVALAVSKTRGIGRIGAAILHLALVGILGPFGLKQSAIVLIWNVAMLVEVWIAFGPTLAVEEVTDRGEWRRWPVRGLCWLGVLLPFGERWGVFDAWPSHALYASHVERVSVLLHESSLSLFPATMRGHLTEVEGGPWHRLDLTSWSREVRGTPVYPQNRACLGLAEALAVRYRSPFPLRVVAFGAADRWTGRRRREEARGADAIRRMGERCLLNAHPWPRVLARREGVR